MTKHERQIDSRQGTRIRLADGRDLINMCANNYLGLSGDPSLIEAGKNALDRWGFGLSSVRFICGTQTVHKTLEQKISAFVGQEDAILYSSCFDANTGLFETLLGEQDAIISDELNHASIIDGVRLCKAKRYRYHNNDMDDLRQKLKEAREGGARICLIATDGVFSMDGSYANLPAICDLADESDALVMVDDSHAVGFAGPTGRGTPELFGVTDRVDILTGTFGKAMGGGSGGYTAARQTIVDLLRQRSRPYLFSNTLAPVIAAVTLAVIDRLEQDTGLRDRLFENTAFSASGSLRVAMMSCREHIRLCPSWSITNARRWKRPKDSCRTASMSPVSPIRSCRSAKPGSGLRSARPTLVKNWPMWPTALQRPGAESTRR